MTCSAQESQFSRAAHAAIWSAIDLVFSWGGGGGAGAAGEFSPPWLTFCTDSYFGIRSTAVLPHIT